MWKRVLISLVVLGGVTVYCAAPNSNAGPPPASASKLRAVRVASVETSKTGRERRFSGLTRAVDRAQLSFTISGRLDARPVELGDRVAKGDLLARLELEPLRNRVRAAQAAEARAEAQLVQSRRIQRRVGSLADAAAMPEAKRDEADSQVEVLEASHAATAVDSKEARRLLSEASLRAPFDAVISEVRSEPGEYVVTGSPVVVLSGTGELEVEVEVPESLIAALAPGQAVRVEVPALAGRVIVEGSITAVGHAAPARGRLFPVVVRLAATEGIVPGMAAELILDVAQDEGLSIPVEAVINPGGMHPSVFQIVDGLAHEVPVEVLRVSGGRAVVRGALQASDDVVVLGHAGLSEGEAVETIR